MAKAVLWDDVILDSGFSLVPNLLLDYQSQLEISSEELCLIIHVLRYKYSHEDPYPRNKTISERMGISSTTLQRNISTLKTKKYLKREQVDDWKYSWDFNGLLDALTGAHVKSGAGLDFGTGPIPKEGPAYNKQSKSNTETSKQAPHTHTQEAENIVRKFYKKLKITDEQWLQMDIKRCEEFIPEFNEEEIVGMLDKRPNIRTFKYLTTDILRNCYPKNEIDSTSQMTEMTDQLLEKWETMVPAKTSEVKKSIQECKDILKSNKMPPVAPEEPNWTIKDEEELPF